jgi:hypothetical protein
MISASGQVSHATEETKVPVGKQAVVVIHGIGEQHPMDTIKNFVHAVWETDDKLPRPWSESEKAAGGVLPNLQQVWSKPDSRTGSLELRRLTTRKSIETATFPGSARTDFYEFYWADLSAGSTWQQVQNWVWQLLIRNPITNVPPKLLLAWLLLWLLSLSVVALAVATTVPGNATILSIHFSDIIIFNWLYGLQTWQLAAATALLAYLTHKFVVPYAGRVVRYTSAEPDNIAVRKEVRERGLQLLRELHAAKYDRIILVGHSLGSILAYDLITYFWAEKTAAQTVKKPSSEFDALCRLCKAANDLAAADAALAKKNPSPSLEAAQTALKTAQEAFRNIQTEFCRLLRLRAEPEKRWIITDFVTLGSPLTHAEFLMAKSKKDLEDRKVAREFPTSPPTGETQDLEVVVAAKEHGVPIDPILRRSFCYPHIDDRDSWQLDQGSPFAVVRWTNIYDPAILVFCGDIISGPLVPTFGPGIVDVDLRSESGHQSCTFTHTQYWSNGAVGEDPRTRIKELRKALDLAGMSRTI